MRIRARAIKRCGQLLDEVKADKGGRPTEKPKPVSAPVPVSRGEAARNAGMSKRQQVTAVRVARVPEQEFEQAVESDDPPTVTELAERGGVAVRTGSNFAVGATTA